MNSSKSDMCKYGNFLKHYNRFNIWPSSSLYYFSPIPKLRLHLLLNSCIRLEGPNVHQVCRTECSEQLEGPHFSYSGTLGSHLITLHIYIFISPFLTNNALSYIHTVLTNSTIRFSDNKNWTCEIESELTKNENEKPNFRNSFTIRNSVADFIDMFPIWVTSSYKYGKIK